MSERSHVHPVFLPVELYVGVSKAMADLEIGKSSAILLMIAEGLHSRGFISREVYEVLRKKYERKLIEVVRGVQEQAEKEVKTVQQIPKKKRVDYSKLSDDELLERYRRAEISKDVIEPQQIQFEAKKRGYQFKFNPYDGTVEVLNIKHRDLRGEKKHG